MSTWIITLVGSSEESDDVRLAFETAVRSLRDATAEGAGEPSGSLEIDDVSYEAQEVSLEAAGFEDADQEADDESADEEAGEPAEEGQ